MLLFLEMQVTKKHDARAAAKYYEIKVGDIFLLALFAEENWRTLPSCAVSASPEPQTGVYLISFSLKVMFNFVSGAKKNYLLFQLKRNVGKFLAYL